MPSTNVPVIDASRLNPALVAEADPGTPFVALDDTNGDNFINANNRVVLIVKNTTVNTLTMTVAATSTYSGIDLPDEVVVIAGDQLCIIGPWPNKDFAAGSTNVVEISYSGTTPAGKILPLKVGQNDA